jgi:hypothetical protein
MSCYLSVYLVRGFRFISLLPMSTNETDVIVLAIAKRDAARLD